MQAVNDFFLSNPEATECFEALGYVLADREAAEKKLAGVKGRQVTRYEREGKAHEKGSDEALEALIMAEEKEQSAHEAYDINATPENMDDWKECQAEVVKCKAVYEKALAEEAKTEQLKAGDAGEGNQDKNPELMDHVVTEDDLINNPDLVTAGVAVGDTIQIPVPVPEPPQE